MSVASRGFFFFSFLYSDFFQSAPEEKKIRILKKKKPREATDMIPSVYSMQDSELSCAACTGLGQSQCNGAQYACMQACTSTSLGRASARQSPAGNDLTNARTHGDERAVIIPVIRGGLQRQVPVEFQVKILVS